MNAIFPICILFGLMFILFVKYSIETGRSLNTLSPSKCLFCEIANGSRTPSKLEFENDEYVIFMDKRPVSTYHYLAIPKTHYDSLSVLNRSHVGICKFMLAHLHISHIFETSYSHFSKSHEGRYGPVS